MLILCKIIYKYNNMSDNLDQQNNQDIIKLTEEQKQELEDKNQQEDLEQLYKIIDTINSDIWLKESLAKNNWDEFQIIQFEMYKDFINDVNEIVKDWVLNKVEKWRLDSIDTIIERIKWTNEFTFEIWNLFLKGLTDNDKEKISDLNWIKSIKSLVYSREILDKLPWDKEYIWGLKIILWLIENVWSSNIKESELKKINILIEEIFWNWLEESDIINLHTLQTLLLMSYNSEQNQKYENFSISQEEKENNNLSEKDIDNTQDILDIFYSFDESWDSMNEISPTLWNFMDSIAVEIKEWLKWEEWNTLWASLRVIIDRFFSIKKDFNKIDFKDPYSIINFSKSLIWFNKDPFMLNLFNSIRFIIPRTLNLIFIWIKEIKNYYLKSTWPETWHWVLIQEIHKMRDNVKWWDYSFDWLKETASLWADVVDNTLVEWLSIINWWTDAVLDFSWTILNTLLLPEKTLEKITDFAWNAWEQLDLFSEFIHEDLDQEKKAQVLYISSYIVTYLSCAVSIPWTVWLNDKVSKLFNILSSITWKPVAGLIKIAKKWADKIKNIPWYKTITIDKIVSINNAAKKNTTNVAKKSTILEKIDGISWKITAFTQDNVLQNNVDYKINLNAS